MVKMTDVTTEKNATDDTQWSIMPAIELALPSLDHDQVDGQMPEFQRSRLNSEKFQSKSQTSKAIFCALCVQIASFSFGAPTNQRPHSNFDALGPYISYES